MDASLRTALNLGGFFVPGNNGLPDLYVHANDPADWVTMQLAARQPTGGNVPTAKDVAETAAGGAAASAMPEFIQKIVDGVLAKLPNPKEYFKGAAIALTLGVVAIGIILFGAYQLTKD